MLIAHGGTLCPIELAVLVSILAAYLPWFFGSSKSRKVRSVISAISRKTGDHSPLAFLFVLCIFLRAEFSARNS